MVTIKSQLENLELFELKKPVGRPRKHSSNAEKQRAYRQRLKENGKKQVSRIVRDTANGEQLQSDILDLHSSLTDVLKAKKPNN